jgi:hypothetical protein
MEFLGTWDAGLRQGVACEGKWSLKSTASASLTSALLVTMVHVSTGHLLVMKVSRPDLTFHVLSPLYRTILFRACCDLAASYVLLSFTKSAITNFK